MIWTILVLVNFFAIPVYLRPMPSPSLKALGDVLTSILKDLPEQDIAELEYMLSVMERNEIAQQNMMMRRTMTINDATSHTLDSSSFSESSESNEKFSMDDMMMGDMPIPDRNSDTIINNNTHDETITELKKANRELWDAIGDRNKEMRLNHIREQILTLVGRGANAPPSNINNHQRQIMENIKEKVMGIPAWAPKDVYTEKVQSFYPSCQIPQNTDEDLWKQGKPMNLYFHIAFPQPTKGTKIDVLGARLRLFKLPSNSNKERCQSTIIEEVLNTPASHFPATSAIENKKIRVTIHRYFRSLKIHRGELRIKTKLVDSQMLDMHTDGEWTWWNILPAIKDWHESGKNFGIQVQVEDEDGVVLQANKYFEPMNCSAEASTNRPLPGFLLDAAQNMAEQMDKTYMSTLVSNKMPLIDLRTMEMPDTEIANTMIYHNTNKYIFDRNFSNEDNHHSRHHHHDVERSAEKNKKDDDLPVTNQELIDSMEQIAWEDQSRNNTLLKILLDQRNASRQVSR